MQTERPEEPILVGSIARAHGIKGEVVVDVWSDAPERFAPGRTVTARLEGGGERAMTVQAARPFGERLLITFEGVGTRTEAEALRGADLTIPRGDAAQLPEGTHYRFELLGLRVVTRGGLELGTIADIFSTGSNDVIVVRGPRGETLLPSLASVVLSVDLERGEMVVEVPPGLNE